MADLAFLLDIRGVEGQVITDPSVTIRLARTDQPEGRLWRFALAGAAMPVRLNDAPAGSPLLLRITMTRYQDVGMLANVQNGALEPLTDRGVITAPRRAEEWLPDFVKWADLPDGFVPLKDTLGASLAFQLGGASNGTLLDETAYDAVRPDDEPAALAKMSLLNLYSRLSIEAPPRARKNWFTRLGPLLMATRERLIAEVDDDFFDLVKTINTSPPDGYNRAGASLHRKNFNAIPGVEAVREMCSVKTDDRKANLQFTVARVRRNGQSACLVDLDMDEHGELIGHTFDLFRHKRTGGTNPIDIHEILRDRFDVVDFGYGLAVKHPIGVVTSRVLPG
jgi:hypothetical protein